MRYKNTTTKIKLKKEDIHRGIERVQNQLKVVKKEKIIIKKSRRVGTEKNKVLKRASTFYCIGIYSKS